MLTTAATMVATNAAPAKKKAQPYLYLNSLPPFGPTDLRCDTSTLTLDIYTITPLARPKAEMLKRQMINHKDIH